MPGPPPSLARTSPVTATVPSGSRWVPQTSGIRGIGTDCVIPSPPSAAGPTVTTWFRRSRSRGLSTTTAPPSGVATAETARAKTPGVAAVRSIAARSEVSGPALGGPPGGGPSYAGRSVVASVGRPGSA